MHSLLPILNYTLNVISVYDEETPVVVAQLTHAAAGAVFGVSKVKGGNRFATTHLAKMAVILFPQTKKAQAWLTV